MLHLILLALSFSSIEGIGYKPYYPANTKCCNGTQYNLQGLCCDNNFVRIDDDDYYLYQCCGALKYDTRTQACCNGNVRDLKGLNCACCGNDVFNGETNQCCGGKLYPLTEKLRTCCGTTSYSLEEGLCVDGEYVAYQKDKPKTLCGKEPIDPVKQLCCTGKVLPRTTNTTVCVPGYPMTFDVLTEVVCGGEKSPNTKGLNSCCGKTPYNAKTHLCCESTNTTVEHVSSVRFKNKDSYYDYTYFSCCAGEAINNTEKMCCGNKVYNKSNSYPYTYCCGEQVYESSSSQSCCRGKVYNSKEERCCTEEIISNAHLMKLTPCERETKCGYVIYDSYFEEKVQASESTTEEDIDEMGLDDTFSDENLSEPTTAATEAKRNFQRRNEQNKMQIKRNNVVMNRENIYAERMQNKYF